MPGFAAAGPGESGQVTGDLRHVIAGGIGALAAGAFGTTGVVAILIGSVWPG
jgi:hypothetical protein